MDLKNKAILARVEKLADAKGTLYSVEPVSDVPMDVLLGIISMKALRSLRKTDVEHKKDELYDLIVYSVKALARLEPDSIVKEMKNK